MPATVISDLWTPQIWIPAADEAARALPALITSGAVAQSSLFDSVASGGGTIANLPFFRDLTDTAEGVQVQGTAPTINNLSSGTNLAPILNREIAFGVEALAASVSGSDPVAGITRQLGTARQKRMQTTLLNILRGLFNFAGAPAASAALSAVRFEAFSETGANPAAGLLIDSTKFNNAAALMGELQANLMNGAIWMHPLIRASLLNADANSFERSSRMGFMLETYKGIPVYVSNALVRAGGTSGVVYDTYILAPGVVGWGMKPQTTGIDASSLQYYERPDINQAQIFDRTRALIHINGTAFTGSPSGQSATNAELATGSNWSLRFQTADRVGVVQIKTNG